MSRLGGPWRYVARLTHMGADGQRRLWRVLLFCWALAWFAGWAALSVLTRAAEKAGEEAGQTYVAVSPLAAEVMDLRDRGGQLSGQPPLLAAAEAARSAGLGPERVRIVPAPGAAVGGPQQLSLRAQGLSLRELVDLLRGLQVQAGLGAVSAHMVPAVGRDNRMDLDLVLARKGG